MKLNELPKTTAKSKKRVGRGYGSGKGGHTSGRGQKGQKSRSKVGLLFEGTKMRKSLIKRMPFLRGKGKLKSFRTQPIIINIKYLNLLPKGSLVNVKLLVKHGLIKAGDAKCGVKILGDGKLEKALTVELPTSKSAAEKIKKAGGKVVIAKSLDKKPAVKKPAAKKTEKKTESVKKTKDTKKKKTEKSKK